MEQIFLSLLLLTTTIIFQTVSAESDYPPPCESKIYCHGPLLHTVQMAGLYKDSKTFVDMKLRYSPAQVLKNFDLFMEKHGKEPTKLDIAAFVDTNFEPEGSEFESWDPSDWHPNPIFLNNITDSELRGWAGELHSFWKELGRKIKDDVRVRPDMYSIIYTDHPVIVPGGRFREIFYWDSFWIMRGLLLSEMKETVKGMLLNFLQMVNQLGYIPNGGRIYFRRSQPPLLIPMFKLYTDETHDMNFLRQSIDVLDQEFMFWIKNRTVNVDLNGRTYEAVRYNVELDGPRPESYREDYELAEALKSEEEKTELYFNLKAAAESGWDFSTRWYINSAGPSEGSLIDTKTRHVIPVELNAIIHLNAKYMAGFYEQLGDRKKAAYYQNVANQYKLLLDEVLWDEEEGCWFDYDLINNKLRKIFYASNIVPLWAGAYDSNDVVLKVLAYLKKVGALKEPGGVPTSPIQSGEQWDYPNGWAPLQYFIVDALDKTDIEEAKTLAFDLAQRWIKTNYKAFVRSNHMFEKYDVSVEGEAGGGGEYEVVIGFGWTNGVVMDFLYRFGDRLRVPVSSPNPANVPHPVIAPATIAIGGLTLAIASLFGISHACRAHASSKNANGCGKVTTGGGGGGVYTANEVVEGNEEETVALMQTIPLKTIAPSDNNPSSQSNNNYKCILSDIDRVSDQSSSGNDLDVS